MYIVCLFGAFPIASSDNFMKVIKCNIFMVSEILLLLNLQMEITLL